MPTIQLQLAVTLGDDAAKILAELIGPALRQAISSGSPFDKAQEARLRASQRALLGGQKIPEDQGLLVDTHEAAKLLKVSEATLLRKYKTSEIPEPIRIGKLLRWRLDALKAWIDGKPSSGKS